MSCDVSSSATKGALNGLLGVFGLQNQFFDSVNDTEMKQLTKQLSSLQAHWSNVIQVCKDKITSDKFDLINQNITYLSQAQKVIDETLEEKIETNSFLIYIAFILIFMILGYILF
jgi:hypothetical protein